MSWIHRQFFFLIPHILFHFRSELLVRINLSDENRQRRNRKTSIGIKTTLIAWIVEVFGSITVLLVHISASQAVMDDQGIVWIVVFIYFVLIPGSYLLSTDEIRGSILEQGWFSSFGKWSNSVEVAPCPNMPLDVENNNNESNWTGEEVISIPTVSSNVSWRNHWKT